MNYDDLERAARDAKLQSDLELQRLEADRQRRLDEQREQDESRRVAERDQLEAERVEHAAASWNKDDNAEMTVRLEADWERSVENARSKGRGDSVDATGARVRSMQPPEYMSRREQSMSFTERTRSSGWSVSMRANKGTTIRAIASTDAAPVLIALGPCNRSRGAWAAERAAFARLTVVAEILTCS